MLAEIKVSGIVQGVGFRPFIYRIAVANNLKGYVKNRRDASVEIVVEGDQQDITQFLKNLKDKKPPLAHIYKTQVRFTKDTAEFPRFTILESAATRELTGSIIPPDIAICSDCLSELRTPSDPRHNYFFITCTNCGPRYTTIYQLPYDRQNTTMQEFEMCQFCREEYADPASRRFHAQTVACPNCGPTVYLTTRTGQPVQHEAPIYEAGRLLAKGHILAIKGYGGFHVATTTTKDEPILKLRKIKHRAQKPFAIMARDIETVYDFAEVNSHEAEMLSSHTRPIVLLKKSKSYFLSEFIAPGLHNIGVMLPYTGLHLMLFDQVEVPAFVMTSANPPSLPIVRDDAEALRTLGSTVDYFLMHSRKISQRCDDSVVRLHDDKTSFIRRSRGYAPAPIHLKRQLNKCVLGVGAEENVTAAILHRDKAFISQYVGDVENLETFTFLKNTINHLTTLTNTKIDAVSCDLHPNFATSRLARTIAEEIGCSVYPVQHHHAHIGALMGEHGLNDMVGIACDGYGYGVNGESWGGEILQCSKGSCQRISHLQEQPLIGGDLATRYPLRMAAGILHETTNVHRWLLANSKYFPHGEAEVQMIINRLDNNSPSLTTTSCGRILDAVSAILHVCHERTYQGEPAIKLESAAAVGRDVLRLKPEIRAGILNTTSAVSAIFKAKDTYSAADLAYSIQSYLARGMAQLAIEAAQKANINAIGFSGGVAYNKHITLTMRKYVETRGLPFYVHEALPAGDGGISFGQAFATAIASD